ncbi:MAG TPA: hypothetical protein V6C95_14960 [Coleofasciculaceae cyanobacterium]
MGVKQVNLTLLKVNEELDIFLENHTAYIYKKAFKQPEFRQRLLAYILKRIPNHYASLESASKFASLSPKSFNFTHPEKIMVQKLIYRGFYQLHQRDKENAVPQEYTPINPSYETSTLVS